MSSSTSSTSYHKHIKKTSGERGEGREELRDQSKEGREYRGKVGTDLSKVSSSVAHLWKRRKLFAVELVWYCFFLLFSSAEITSLPDLAIAKTLTAQKNQNVNCLSFGVGVSLDGRSDRAPKTTQFFLCFRLVSQKGDCRPCP